MSGQYGYSYTHAVIPFLVVDSSNFSVEGFEVNGNVQLTTRDPGVVEGWSYGLHTANCHDYELRDLYIHHTGTDGILLGHGTPADKNIIVQNVILANNARQGMSVLSVRGMSVKDSYFLDTGRTGGEYGNHAPSAGVDIEPEGEADVQTGEIVFQNCEFSGNRGTQFAAAVTARTDDVLVEDSKIIAADDSYTMVMILSIPYATVRNSFIDTRSGAIYPSWKVGTGSLISGVTIHSSGRGIVYDNGGQLVVDNSELLGTHVQPYGNYMPWIRGPLCDFTNNKIFVPKEAYNNSGSCQYISLLQKIGLSSQNHFSTDLESAGDECFGVSYDTSHVLCDHYNSGKAFRPSCNSLFDPEECFSQN